jgi:microcystin-dependent protein
MGLETGTYVNDLVITNPPNSDPEAQGAAHLRLIKSVLKNTFPNATKAFSLPTASTKTTNYTVLASDAQSILLMDTTAAALSLTLPTLASGDAGWSFEAMKINAGLNPYFIVPASGTLRSGELAGLAYTRRSIVGRRTKVVWTGTAWIADRVVNPPVGSIIPCVTFALPIGYEWPNGQTLVNAALAYPDLVAALGSGQTPDLRQRAIFGTDLGGAPSGRITVGGGNFDGTVLEGVGGSQNHTLTVAELPVFTPSGTIGGATSSIFNTGSQNVGVGGSTIVGIPTSSTSAVSGASFTFTGNAIGSGGFHSIMPPAMTIPYLFVVE